tara:strand:+ start:36587 stop:36931 length:345 start_codon:yes stop_codon:yes gene_type:complete
MEESLEKALEFSNYSVTLNNQKRILYEKYEENLILYYLGGTFTASKELINFCTMLLSKTSSSLVIDDNKTPIQIPDLEDFTESLLHKYTEATNQYNEEYEILSTKRSVEGLVDV